MRVGGAAGVPRRRAGDALGTHVADRMGLSVDRSGVLRRRAGPRGAAPAGDAADRAA